MGTLDFDKIRFGVNYVPSRRWWFCWNDFDPGEIASDLDAIAAAGADHIRIMLIWPFFQPNPSWISPKHLEHLDALMRVAGERNLDVCVTMLTGWLSGWAFRPVFDRSEGFYTSPVLRQAVELYFRTCAARLNTHSNFLGFDLGNELNCCWRAPNTREGDAWMHWLLELCESISPGKVHVNGVDHQPWFASETFSPSALARGPKVVAIHAWIEFTGARKRGGCLEPVCSLLPAAMTALVRAHAGCTRKPVWLQEFGASSHWMDAAIVPEFLEKSVRAAVSGGICWLTWWASHDIQPCYQFDPLEYDLGLISLDNRLKPAGERFRELAMELKGTSVVQPTQKRYEIPTPNFDSVWRWLEMVQCDLQK